MQDFKRILNLNCKQKKDWTTIFSIGFQVLKI